MASIRETFANSRSTGNFKPLRLLHAWQRRLLAAAIALSLRIPTAHAQYYNTEPEGPTILQKLLTSPAASLIMVLIGSAGLFNLFFATGKGDQSDRKQLLGLVCCLLVLGMCWYRFSLWNDPNFNARPR